MLDVPRDGITQVHFAQSRHGCADRDAYIPSSDGEVVEGRVDFELDGVAFPGAEIRLEFLHSNHHR